MKQADTSQIPVIGFSAYSGVGKTTLVEKLIRILKAKGLRVAVIKHDGHGFEMDHEGKDTWRFTRAGADITMIASAKKTAYIEQREYSLKQMIEMIRDVDLILVEGYKNADIPRIGMARKETGKGFTADIGQFIALVTNMEVKTELPCFDPDDAEGVAQWIITHITEKNA